MNYFETILLDISTSELLGVEPNEESKECINIYKKVFQYLRDGIVTKIVLHNTTIFEYLYNRDTNNISFYIYPNISSQSKYSNIFKSENIMTYIEHRFSDLDLLISLRNYVLNYDKIKFIYL